MPSAKFRRFTPNLYLAGCLVLGMVGSLGAGGVQQSETIRILSYNIKHGQGMDDRVDLERAAAVINSLQPDLVALQEIDSEVRRTDGVDQAQRLGELTGMHAVFGDFMDYQGGQYGMALLSRYPFAETTNHRLPPGAEPRSAMAARIAIGDSGQEIIFVGIHLYRTAEERSAQARRVVEVFEDESTPVILAGDFNSTPDSDVIDLVRRSWTIPDKGEDRLTFSSTDPRREIDFIMYRAGGPIRSRRHSGYRRTARVRTTDRFYSS